MIHERSCAVSGVRSQVTACLLAPMKDCKITAAERATAGSQPPVSQTSGCYPQTGGGLHAIECRRSSRIQRRVLRTENPTLELAAQGSVRAGGLNVRALQRKARRVIFVGRYEAASLAVRALKPNICCSGCCARTRCRRTAFSSPPPRWNRFASKSSSTPSSTGGRVRRKEAGPPAPGNRVVPRSDPLDHRSNGTRHRGTRI
jgi:hypothetical protein